MRIPHLSTGAWIFATAALVLAVAAPVSYAAVSSTVAIGNANNRVTANVTNNHQLLTTTIAPNNVVVDQGFTGGGCAGVYTPPAGKAVVVTSVTYDSFSNTAGGDHFAYLMDTGCADIYDVVETHELDVTESRTFPIGLPMPSVGIYSPSGTGSTQVYITGYLIPASQLPAATPAARLPARLHATH